MKIFLEVLLLAALSGLRLCKAEIAVLCFHVISVVKFLLGIKEFPP